MKNSFKISVAQFSPIIGDIRKNLETHLRYIDQAINEKSALIIFPELSLTGYSVMDSAAELAIKPDDDILKPLKDKSKNISVCSGGIELSDQYFIYNASWFMEDGEILKVTRKIYPPTYGIFDEKRFFAQGREVRSFDSKLGRFGVLICNDARHPGLVYTQVMDGCKFLITQSAVPARGFPKDQKPAPTKYFEIGNRHYAAVYGIYTIFANLSGYEDGILFSGNSLVCAPGGFIIKEAPLFDSAMITVEVSEDEIKRYRASTPILGEEDMNIVIDELTRIKHEKYRV